MIKSSFNLLQSRLCSFKLPTSPIFSNRRFFSEKKVIELLEEELDWKFVRGGGPGGQKTNKTSNCAVVTHLPTNIQVKCHSSRSKETNINLAKKRLKEKLDQHFNGDLSKNSQQQKKKSKQKARRKRKSKEKHNQDSENSTN